MLLISNMAGWMHVGCSHTHSECCSSGVCVAESGCFETDCCPGGDCTLSTSLAQQESWTPTLDFCQHSCCAHECKADAESSHSQNSGEKTESGDPQTCVPARFITTESRQYPSDHEHDSDSCSVCQSFNSCRNASFTMTPSVSCEVASTGWISVFADCDFTDELLTNSILVRGPPQV